MNLTWEGAMNLGGGFSVRQKVPITPRVVRPDGPVEKDSDMVAWGGGGGSEGICARNTSIAPAAPTPARNPRMVKATKGTSQSDLWESHGASLSSRRAPPSVVKIGMPRER